MIKLTEIGLVAIGRNEGDRLHRCLLSVLGTVAQIVYVDSGSCDRSVELAHSLGVEVVDIDLSLPFTAARARNEGFTRLLQLNPYLKFVQFVDGDCEIVPGWLEQAQQTLLSQPQVAVVCGRRRERFPGKSIYNLLCDLEWDTLVGEANACGGDSLMRVAALKQVGGFNQALIAGEEPELCWRLRQQEWKVIRLNAEMSLHDAQMTKFSQWWQRSRRSGHAYAEGAWLHGNSPERYNIKENRSICLWGLIVPGLALGLEWLTQGWSLVLLLGYAWLSYRIYRHQQQRQRSPQQASLYTLFCVLGKFPQCQGQLTFYFSQLLGKRSDLIEYKSKQAHE